MTHDGVTHSPLQRLVEDDAVGQLRRREGLMATLGSEGGALKLDWVEAIARLLADPAQLEEVEAEAQAIRERGIRHIIWAGMGGSVITVRVLRELGFGNGYDDDTASQQGGAPVALYPLDSTDPAALNAIVRKLAAAKHIALPAPAAGKEAEDTSQPAVLRSLLYDVMMIGVSMGMTSEEPITHLTWFTELLQQAQLRPEDHLLVMTLPGSYLDAFAREHRAPSRPLQLDGGTGTGGRMSAPATRVFLLPAALYLTDLPGESGQLRSVLQHAWDEYNLELATTQPAEHPFVRLAAALSAASSDGACRLLLRMPEDWRVFVTWLEQLMEESLGKGGKGVVVFDDQTLNHAAAGYHAGGMLRVHVVSETTHSAPDQTFVLSQPSLASNEPHTRLAALAASFLGWQLSMALYGYLHGLPFAGQPAVEHYKARARALRTQPDPLQVTSNWRPALQDGLLTLLVPPMASAARDVPQQIGPQRDDSEPVAQEPASSPPAAAFASVLREALSAADAHRPVEGIALGYLDLTVNGEAQIGLLSMLDNHLRTIGNKLLGIPVKLRQAPAAYHSTEQNEMDGPPYLVSLRLVARDAEETLLGRYTNTFLHAQAVSTWQAMLEAGRPCCLLVIGGALDHAIEQLSTFFSRVEYYVHSV